MCSSDLTPTKVQLEALASKAISTETTITTLVAVVAVATSAAMAAAMAALAAEAAEAATAAPLEPVADLLEMLAALDSAPKEPAVPEEQILEAVAVDLATNTAVPTQALAVAAPALSSFAISLEHHGAFCKSNRRNCRSSHCRRA